MDIVQIKDYAYPIDDPHHFGLEVDIEEDEEEEYSWHQEPNNEFSVIYEQKNESNEVIKNSDQSYDNNDNVNIVTNEYNNDIEIENPPLVRAVALYSFTPENGNELELESNQIIFVNDSQDFGGWLVAYNIETGATGLVPSQYVRIISDGELEALDRGVEYVEEELGSERVSGEEEQQQKKLDGDHSDTDAADHDHNESNEQSDTPSSVESK